MTHGKIDVVLIGHNALNFDVLDRMFNSDTKTSPRLGLQELVQSQLLMKEWRINLRFESLSKQNHFQTSETRSKNVVSSKKTFELLHQREEEKKPLNSYIKEKKKKSLFTLKARWQILSVTKQYLSTRLEILTVTKTE